MPHAENRDCLRGNGLNNGLFKSGHKGLFRNAELSGQPKSEREIIFTRKGPIGNSLMRSFGIVRWREIDTLARSYEFLSCFQTKGDGDVTGREFEHRRIGTTRNQRHIHCPALQRLQTSITRQLE